ncbi:MAG: hypothetical protein LRS48_03630 [Desulfurococcales archaeon]|nr:hypothetical protein [Desulfurococcales archaeon]
MLKLRYEANATLERQVEAGARQLARILERGVEQGIVRIAAYPRLDSIVSGAVLFTGASLLGARPVFNVGVEPPEYIDVPSIVLGHPNIAYKTGDVDAPLIAFSPRIPAGPPPDTVFIEGDASTAGLVAATLIAYGGVLARRDLLSLLVASLYYGGKADIKGRFYGVDAAVIDSLLSSSLLEIEIIPMLKAYEPNQHSVCESISVTSNPYYPMLTGDVDECKSTLSANGLSEVVGKRLVDLDDRTLEKVVVSILSRVQGEVKREVDPAYYYGNIILSKPGHPLEDYRMGGDVLLHTIDSLGLGALLSLTCNFELEYPVSKRNLVDYASKIRALVEEARPKRLKTASWFRAYTVNASVRDSLTLLSGALRLQGLLDNDAIISVDDGGEYIVSGLQVEEALGYGSLKRLVDVKILEEYEDGVFFRIARRE